MQCKHTQNPSATVIELGATDLGLCACISMGLGAPCVRAIRNALKTAECLAVATSSEQYRRRTGRALSAFNALLNRGCTSATSTSVRVWHCDWTHLQTLDPCHAEAPRPPLPVHSDVLLLTVECYAHCWL